MMRRTILIFSLIFGASALHAYGGSVPAGYPSGFLMGMVNDDFLDACNDYGLGAGAEVNTVAQWMAAVDPSHTGFQFSYRYLQGGFAADAAGWYAQYPYPSTPGGTLGNYATLAKSYGYLPVFIYYQVGDFNTGLMANAVSMGKYFQDWSAAMSLINGWMTSNPGTAVTVDVEPDLAGWVQQQGYSPTSFVVKVKSATNPGGSAPYFQPTQADTFQGYCQALLMLKDHYVSAGNAANLHIAFHVSGWASGNNPAAIAGQSVAAVQAQASTIAGFVNACQPASGSKFDLFLTDPSGYDGGYNATYDWTALGVSGMADQYAAWLNALSGDLGLRAMLWQVPMGNSHMKDVLGHYKDARPEYFLADSPLNTSGYGHNLCYYYNSGCLGVLWGRGDYHGTGVMDIFYPNSWGSISSQQDCGAYPGGSTGWSTGSWSSPASVDDDAGFFRSHIANNAAWGQACSGPAATATVTPTGTPSATRTVTRSPSPTASATPSGTATATAAAATATPSLSPSATRTATRSPSPTASATPSSTATVTAAAATATPSFSPSPTMTPTGTSSGTLSATPSNTASPAPASATPTRSLTPTGMPSGTATRTALAASGTPTASLSPSPMPTATPTATAPAASATGTATPTGTATASVTASGSPTLTVRATATSSLTAAGTPTPSPASTGPSATSTVTSSPAGPGSPTFTPSGTCSLTSTVSPPPAPTASATPSGTRTATPPPLVPPTASRTPRAAPGGGKVLQVLAWPEPRPQHLAVQVDGPCDGVALRVYSMGWHRVADLQGPGTAGAAWVEVGFSGLGLPSGAYYVVGQASNSGVWGPAARGKLVVLR